MDYRRINSGFSLIEIMVATVFVAMITLLIGSLGSEVAKLMKTGRQSAAILEMSGRTNSLIRDPAKWLTKLRVAPQTAATFNSCMPGSRAEGTPYSCPPFVDALTANSDDTLTKIAGPARKASQVPLVDMMGNPIAGTEAAPLYLDNDGRTCDGADAATKCALKSTGLMLRNISNGLLGEPKDVALVVKLERNLASTANNGARAMRPYYTSLDMNGWQRMSTNVTGSGTCVDGIQLGYQPDGEPHCVKATLPCTSPLVNVGVAADGTSICTSVPTCTTGGPVLNTATNTLVCSTTYPCLGGKIFLGYALVTGDPICNDPAMSCPSGHILMGDTCVAVPTCTLPQVPTFTGPGSLGCRKIAGVVNGANGINGAVGPPGGGQNEVAVQGRCNDNQEMFGIDATGVLCRPKAVAVTGALQIIPYEDAVSLYTYTRTDRTNPNKTLKWFSVQMPASVPSTATHVLLTVKCLEVSLYWKRRGETVDIPEYTHYTANVEDAFVRSRLLCLNANNTSSSVTQLIRLKANAPLEFFAFATDKHAPVVDVRIVGYQ